MSLFRGGTSARAFVIRQAVTVIMVEGFMTEGLMLTMRTTFQGGFYGGCWDARGKLNRKD